VSLALSVVWSDRCLLHEPAGEVWIGLRTEGTEVAARAERIRGALLERGAPLVDAHGHPDAALTRVHDPGLVAYLETAWDEWAAAGLPEDPGQDRVVPYVFAHAALTAERPARAPEAVWARPGYFAYDTMTLVGPGTWDAVRAAADVALSAVDLVLDGERAAYACCRPPGHHACRSCFGGSCYLNNAAIAAAALRDRLERPVAVLDVDAHHGNGTQEIFYEDGDMLVGSVHVDPGAGWFPHFLGFADEVGAGPGRGANLNLPLAPGAGDDEWLQAVRALVAWALDAEPGALVVSLGVDAAAGDPESPLRVTADGFREAGRVLGAMDVPTVLVQEGGYDLASLGALIGETLAGVEEGLP
jgi:acetoin utilization deacetylase AcuC-like enzyme